RVVLARGEDGRPPAEAAPVAVRCVTGGEEIDGTAVTGRRGPREAPLDRSRIPFVDRVRRVLQVPAARPPRLVRPGLHLELLRESPRACAAPVACLNRGDLEAPARDVLGQVRRVR